MSAPRYFTIFGAMRTGSNLLESTLSQYSGLVGLGELFNPGFIGAPGVTSGWGFDLAARDRDPEAFLEAVVAAHPGRVPGFRLFDGHDARIRARAAADKECARIVLTRDPLESYVSLLAAQATGQWLLRREEDRKRARVRFDPTAFAAYRARLAAHYAALRAAMRAAGAPWIELDHADLADPASLDGAARHAGARGPRIGRKPPIIRQNPEPLSERVENPEDLPADTSAAASRQIGGGALFEGSRDGRLLWALVPGAAEASIRGLATEFGGAASAPVSGLSAETVFRRLRRGALAFGFVRHPAARLSALLVATTGGDDVDACLDGLEARGPTGPFAPQTAFLSAAAAIAPLTVFARAEDGPGALLARLGAPPEPATGRFRRRLGRTPRLSLPQQRRVHSLYEEDYRRLGYPPPRR